MDCTYKNDKDKWISCDIALMSFLSINVATSPVGKLLLKDSNKHKSNIHENHSGVSIVVFEQVFAKLEGYAQDEKGQSNFHLRFFNDLRGDRSLIRLNSLSIRSKIWRHSLKLV